MITSQDQKMVPKPSRPYVSHLPSKITTLTHTPVHLRYHHPRNPIQRPPSLPHPTPPSPLQTLLSLHLHRPMNTHTHARPHPTGHNPPPLTHRPQATQTLPPFTTVHQPQLARPTQFSHPPTAPSSLHSPPHRTRAPHRQPPLAHIPRHSHRPPPAPPLSQQPPPRHTHTPPHPHHAPALRCHLQFLLQVLRLLDPLVKKGEETGVLQWKAARRVQR